MQMSTVYQCNIRQERIEIVYRTLCNRQVSFLRSWVNAHPHFFALCASGCVLCLALLLSSCGEDVNGAGKDEGTGGIAVTVAPATPVQTSIPPADGGATPTPHPGGAGASDVPMSIINRAQAALANHLSVMSDTLTLMTAEVREWPDSSLGCPAEGQAYLTVITPGYLLSFSDVGGQSYPIHTTRDGDPLILCQEGQPVQLESKAQP